MIRPSSSEGHLNKTHRRYTLGYISSWQVYEGASVEPYAHSLIQGMRAAARDLNCNLLLACGVGPVANIHSGSPAWPVPESSENFTPVGPNNCDGLLVLPTELTPEQSYYLQELRASSFPLMMTGTGERGPSVITDNAGGIRLAVEHLRLHGHTRIGFVAGLDRPDGDSALRRAAFSDALRSFAMAEDPRLIAAGEHSVLGGRRAVEQILATGASFSALVCSNDRSAIGAIEALQAAGRRVPEEVAVTGFDDVPEAGAGWPPLTTLRSASFEKGYQATVRLVALIEGRLTGDEQFLIPTPLVVRRSCGCDPLRGGMALKGKALKSGSLNGGSSHRPAAADNLSEMVAAAMMREVRAIARDEAAALGRDLAAGFERSLQADDSTAFHRAIERVLARSETLDEDLYAWNAAVDVLRAYAQQAEHSTGAQNMADDLHLEVIERWRRQSARRQLLQTELTSRLNSLSSQLLTALDQSQIKAVLDDHLAGLGVQRMLLAGIRPEPDPQTAAQPDQHGRYEILFSFGFERERSGEQFAAWQFPLQGWGTAGQPVCLAMLPFNVPDRLRGFMACEAENMASLAMLLRSLEAALRTSYLYADAVQGRQMAEEANLLKSRFLSTVSHELRTPLNLIGGLSGILLRQKGQPPGPNLWQDLERIYVNSQHLSRLIGDVLDLASSTSGHLRLLREPLDLAEVLRPVIATGEQMAHDKGLAWSASLPERGPFVLGDRTRLRQVALNFINNAVKFTLHGEVCLTITSANREVTVAVRDTGLGVAPADQSFIWGDFSRSEAVLRQGIGGIGLGLAITRELVERQGGHISVESSGIEGQGSTFSFSLPVIEAPRGLSPAEALSRLEAPESIAILASQAGLVAELVGPLRQRGFRVVVHTPLEDDLWLEKVLADPPGAILIEEHLATQQGWELLAELKRSPLTAQLPVLVCSAHPQAGGAVLELDYQTKPLNLDQLSRLLRLSQLSGERPVLLVVDDDPTLRALHCRLIAQQVPDGQILQAANGQEALDAMRQVRPNLVLLDLMMPEVDGFGVLEQMHASDRLRDVPVVVLTAKVLTDNDLQRLNQGVATVLTKGVFSSNEVIERIAGVMSKERTLGVASQRLVRRAIGYIQAHFAASLTRDQIASYVNISADHLTDCFHQELGITPIAYLIRYRIYRACQLLDQGDRSITEVALEVGFSESANFSRAFQREMGLSPRAYMREKRSRQPGS